MSVRGWCWRAATGIRTTAFYAPMGLVASALLVGFRNRVVIDRPSLHTVRLHHPSDGASEAEPEFPAHLSIQNSAHRFGLTLDQHGKGFQCLYRAGST